METKQPQTSPAQTRENIMGTMEINPLLVKLSVPMMISMLVQALYNVVDSVFVSHVSESALTAVSLAFSLQNVMIAVGVGTGVGVNAMLSKSLGEKNQHRANATAKNGIFLSLCSFVVFLVIGLTCMKPYFYAQTSDAAIAQQGIQYLSVCCIFSLGLFTQTMGEKLLAATGRTQLSMISQLVGAVVNIILDPIFIFGLDLGISGAAIATLLSQCVSASILASFFLRGQSEIRVSIRCVSTAPKIYLTIFKSGMPSFFRQGMASVSAMALNFNAGVYGDAAVAAMAIVTKVFNFLLSAVIGFGQGMQPVVGYNYGAKELGRVRQAVSFSLKFCTVILTVAAAAGAVFAPQIVQFFRNDPAVVAVGTQAFRFQCISLPLAAVLVFANMLFQSLGKSWRASLLALCRQGMFFIPLVYLLPMHFGLLGLEVTQMCSDLIAFLVSAAFLLHYFRREFDRV